MKTSRCTGTAALFLLCFSLSAFSFGIERFKVSPLSPKMSRYLHFSSFAQQGHRLAKKTAQNRDTSVVSRIDYFEKNGNEWVPAGYMGFDYGMQGKISSVTFRGDGDSSISIMIMTFDPNGIDIHMKQTDISLSSPGDTILSVESVSSYYPSYQYIYNTFANFYQSFTGLIYENSFSLYTDIDSSMTISRQMDTLTGEWYTFSWYSTKNTDLGENKFSIQTASCSYYEDDSSCSRHTEILQYRFHKAAGINSDTFFVTSLDSNGTPEDSGEIIQTYNENGDPIQIEVNSNDGSHTTSEVMMQSHYFYNAAGKIDSIYIIEKDYDSSALTDTAKIVYSYAAISPALHNRRVIAAAGSPPQATLKNGIFTVTTPAEQKIISAEQLDLQGRVVQRYAIARDGATRFRFPPARTGNGLFLLRLQTDRGRYLFKGNSIH